MDPLRTDLRPAEALSGIERDARIEQLLLAGLDEYFAHRYEHAISLWTRVLFLDRQHDRARAYIERARRAQAERLRESEALLEQGLDALRAGDVERARALVSGALDRGASEEDAHGVLERIERLGVAQSAPRTRQRPRSAMPAHPLEGLTSARSSAGEHRWTGILLGAASLGLFAVAAWGLIPQGSAWPALFTGSSSTSPAVAALPRTTLPIPRSAEVHLTRARLAMREGRLHDALAALDRVPLGDSLHRDAEALRAAVQRQLLTRPDPPPE